MQMLVIGGSGGGVAAVSLAKVGLEVAFVEDFGVLSGAAEWRDSDVPCGGRTGLVARRAHGLVLRRGIHEVAGYFEDKAGDSMPYTTFALTNPLRGAEPAQFRLSAGPESTLERIGGLRP